MKKTIKLAITASIILGSSAYASNGHNLIGVGAKSLSMGGGGVGMSHGAESVMTNPALITNVKGIDISLGGTILMPDVSINRTNGVTYQSDADKSFVPEVAIATTLRNGWYLGIGMFETTSLGVDYSDAIAHPSHFNFVTNMQLMQLALPLAYKSGSLSFGIAPVIQHGSLDINYFIPDLDGPGPMTTTRSDTDGLSKDFGFGVNVGVAYKIDNLTLGATYKSAIDMEYKGQLSNATAQFGEIFGTSTISDNLQKPAEIGVGLSYVMGKHTIAADYKRIKWSSAKGYDYLGWEDQNVYILGYQYSQTGWALRAGYNYAKSPMKERRTNLVQESDNENGVINTFNISGFPAISEKHYTIGGTYDFNQIISTDISYLYSPGANIGLGNTNTVVSEQKAVSLQLNFKF